MSDIEMYPCEAQGAWFEVGHHGERGTLIAPMHLDGSYDPEEIGEAECTYEEATGHAPPPCSHVDTNPLRLLQVFSIGGGAAPTRRFCGKHAYELCVEEQISVDDWMHTGGVCEACGVVEVATT